MERTLPMGTNEIREAALCKNAKRVKRRPGLKPGESRHPLYKTWAHIRDRCTNKYYRQWNDYGGRGITIYSPWLESFAQFSKDIESELGTKPSRKHTLDRKDNNGHYEPGNLRWATRAEQTLNRRVVIKDGNGVPVVERATKAGIVNGKTARHRVSEQGWDTETAINTPSRMETYQPVVSATLVDGRYIGSTVLMLSLGCGCVIRRQYREYRPIPKRARCSKHEVEYA